MVITVQNFLYPLFATLFFTGISALYYYKLYFKRDIAAATVMFSLLVFCIVFFVSFEHNIGLGIGLLGILSLIRLRSTPENLVDISFVFYAITIGLLNASIQGIGTILLVNAIISIVLYFLSTNIFFKKRIVKTRIIFDDLNFEEMHSREELKKRIKKDLKIEALTAEITKIDYMKDCVTVNITYEVN
jgi:hypothetical protein